MATYQIVCDTKNDMKKIISLLETRLDMVYKAFLSTQTFFGWFSFKRVGGYKSIQSAYDIEKEIQK